MIIGLSIGSLEMMGHALGAICVVKSGLRLLEPLVKNLFRGFLRFWMFVVVERAPRQVRDSA